MIDEFQILQRDISALHWTEKTEILILTAMLATIPINSGISLVFTCCWFLSVVLKNSFLKRWSFFAWHQDKSYHYEKNAYILIPMMCYWLVYLISMLWTENIATGWVEVGEIVWFFLIPLTCLCTDFRQKSRQGLRAMFWLYVLSLMLVFGFLLIKTILLTIQSSSHSFMENVRIFDLYRHHAYTSLYIIAGLAFLYTELIRKQSGMMRFLISFCIICLLLYLFFANSRAGILGLILLTLMCASHACIVRKKNRQGIISIIVVLALVAIVHYALPDQYRRLSKTTSELAQGETSDIRFLIMEKAWTVVKDNALLGVGAGDRLDSLVPQYGTLAKVSCPHCQFLDTWLATGVFGMLILWVMLILPMIVAWRKRQIFPILINTILIVNLLVESMLERQMCVVFLAVIYVYYLLLFQGDNNPVSH